MKNFSLLILFVFIAVAAMAGETHYVFYLHGQIVEGSKTDPISESYGRYEYSRIIETLQKKGYIVISERRPANTEGRSYALKISEKIDSLKKTGISSENITVIGASKGAVIAMQVSDLLKDKNVRFVLMAGCSDMAMNIYHFNLYGRILSIYEKSDQIGRSCKDIKSASSGISKFKEIELTTGKMHGFIYQPLDEWIIPACEWIEK
jgi:hypothetical protein